MEVLSNGLAFNEESHSYELNGEPLMSVSEVLEPLFPMTSVPPDVLRIAADRGTRVHEATELYDLDLLDEVDVDIAPYLTAYANWKTDYQVREWDFVEHRMGNLDLGYAGTADRIGFIDGVPVIVDLKTSASCDMIRYSMQLAAYNTLYQAESGVHCKTAVLQLKKDGGYAWRPVCSQDQQKATDTFLALLKLRKEINEWKAKGKR